MRSLIELAKPRITAMVLVTTLIGYRLAGGGLKPRLAWALLGTALASCAAGALNQLFEKEQDARMRRTSLRPLPQGRIDWPQALAFGLFCAVSGLALLAWKVNTLSCVLAASSLVSYLLLYTPLKLRTPQSTWVGAVSGALPPLIGWAAASGRLSAGAWALFAIQFLWQIPHFLAIFWIHREDYAAAGFRVMPVVDPGGGATACQIALHSFALLLASVMPTLCGLAGLGYGYGALALSLGFLVLGLRSSWTMALLDARRLFFASLVYLPLLFGMLVLGHAAPSASSARGGLHGRVTFKGALPKAKAIPMNIDPACFKQHPGGFSFSPIVAGAHGELANVFVYVKKGLEGRSFPIPEPSNVILNQKGCWYHPRVSGVMVGQKLAILNSDPTMHNVNAAPDFNASMPPGVKRLERTFKSSKVMFKIKCDVHPWMSAYVGVLTHPYYAVTGLDGRYRIAGLPPGHYVLEAWHESLGTVSQEVDVPQGSAARDFVFAVEEKR